MRWCLSLIFAIVGLVVLFVISNAVRPPEISLEEISKYEGKKVVFKGMVEDIYFTSGGNTVLMISNENGTEVKIFAYGKRNVFVGDWIIVRGTVQKYEIYYEVFSDSIQIIKHVCREVDLSQLAENPISFVNKNVNFSAYVSDIKENEVTVKDGDYQLRIILPVTLGEDLKKGEKIRVEGKFLYDPESFSYCVLSTEVKVCE